MALPAATSAAPLLEVTKLEVVYHRVATAIQGVSLRVPPSGIVAIIGTNGAGKTTTLRAISGFLGGDDAQITDGSITFRGERLNALLPHEITRRGVVLVPEREKVFETLTVHENLLASGAALPTRRRQHILEQVFALFPVLTERRGQLAGYLSGGERQMLTIAMALLCEPRLLLVDELSLGLAPLILEQLLGLLARLRQELGLAILLVEQNVGAALALADYGYVMEHGRVVFDGAPERLRAHEDIQEFYLGLGGRAARSYRDVKQYRRRRRWFG